MEKISLNGTWMCKLPDDRTFDVQVPGCWDTYIPEKNIGTAVSFKKTVILQKYNSKRYFLYFSAVSYFCDIEVNGNHITSHEGMWDHFRVDITDSLLTGENEILIHITKPGYKSSDRFPVREVLSGFIPDILCTFGGIWDDVWIECCDTFYIKSHYAKGDKSGKGQIYITADIFSASDVFVTADILSPEKEKIAVITRHFCSAEKGEHTFILDFAIENAELWDTQNPNLYQYILTINCACHCDTVSKSFGFRDISCDGTKLLLNDVPVYARGLLHWGYYDEEIIPNPSAEVIQQEIDKCKQFGFNMIKHCLYIPREEYFELADQNGIFLWIELPLWLPDFTPELSERIRKEYPEILEQIAGHPSVIMLSLGCELDAKADSSILKEMYSLVKHKSSALVRDNSGSGECYNGLAVDFADFSDYHFYSELQNIENLIENFTPSWRNHRPWLFGEFCDSDTMRDLEQVRNKKGVDTLFWELGDPVKNPICSLKPDFYADKHDERMSKSGIRSDLELLNKLSLNHSMVHRKTTLEYTRAFSEICGYNITSIRDVPIATSGMFDDYMEPKFDSDRFLQVNSDIVLVPAWDLTRVWINGDRIMNRERYNFFSGDYYGLHIILSNYSPYMIKAPVLDWELSCCGEQVWKGTVYSDSDYATGDVKELGYISLTLPQVIKPQTYVISVIMKYGDKTVQNSWPVFVYPKPEKINKKVGLYDPANIFTGIEKIIDRSIIEDEQEIKNVDYVITSRLTPQICRFAEKGGSVFFVQRGAGYLPVKKVAFWREGMIRRYDHPILDGMDYQEWYDDLRFFGLATDTAFDTESLESGPFSHINSIIRRYDCRQWQATDYMLELKLGSGTILATTLRFEGGMGKQPLYISNNKLGQWLLNNILNYIGKQVINNERL